MLYTQSEIQTIVSSFIDLINTPIPSKAGKKRVEQKEAPSPKNAYKLKGSKAQLPREAPKNSYAISLEERGDNHHEKHLQKAIIDNPFLLHTPELYAGGLYLDSLLNQLRLPFSRITDFCYLTTQERTIKITLVEIEQSAKRVFTRDVLGGKYFHKDTTDAIDQVKDWQKHLHADCHRSSLLANLSRLFVNYPLQLFLPSGDPHPLTRIELSYLLIVGNEMPNEKQQELIDNLYVNDNILFMSYPMMLAIMNRDYRQKNVLSMKARAIEV
ncbi:Shedu anti-phage system protein SduA domain-containing protein [Pseudomonas serbica]